MEEEEDSEEEEEEEMEDGMYRAFLKKSMMHENVMQCEVNTFVKCVLFLYFR